MATDFKTMEKKIDDYFSNISKTQLAADLKKAQYSFYKNVKARLIDPYPETEELIFHASAGTSGTIIAEIDIDFKELSIPDSYVYNYKLAA